MEWGIMWLTPPSFGFEDSELEFVKRNLLYIFHHAKLQLSVFTIMEKKINGRPIRD